MRYPMFSQNHTMHVEILSTRANIEPFSVVHYQAADLTTFAYPIHNNWNERNFLLRRDSLENLRIPNSDVREIKNPLITVAIRDIHNAVIAQSHLRSQTRFTQRERDIIPAAEMFVD